MASFQGIAMRGTAQAQDQKAEGDGVECGETTSKRYLARGVAGSVRCPARRRKRPGNVDGEQQRPGADDRISEAAVGPMAKEGGDNQHVDAHAPAQSVLWI